MICLGSLGRPILRHVYVCPDADVDEYSYASLYIPNLPFSVEAFTPHPTPPRSIAGTFIRLIKVITSLSISFSPSRRVAYFLDNVAGITQATFCVTINSERTVQ